MERPESTTETAASDRRGRTDPSMADRGLAASAGGVRAPWTGAQARTLPADAVSRRPGHADLSLVIPCFDEEGSVRGTATELVRAFRDAGAALELVLVDNGSTDRTGRVIDELLDEGFPVRKVTVEVNQGYGYGVLCGLRASTGHLVGFMGADGQIEPRDVVRAYQVAARAKTPKLVKVRRRLRLDGIVRGIVSSGYNLAAAALFGGLGSRDINGSPKILPRHVAAAMDLRSHDWFLDAEVLIKAKRMGLPVYDLNVIGQRREEGASHVRASTCWEFARNLLRYRFGRDR